MEQGVDLMIAATAIAKGLPLYTTNPGGFTGVDDLIRIIPVTGPSVPHEQPVARAQLMVFLDRLEALPET